jgi:hypothetical protein
MQNLLQKISNDELLNLVGKILAKPGEVTVQDAIDLRKINEEFSRRDAAFFSAIQSKRKGISKRGISNEQKQQFS